MTTPGELSEDAFRSLHRRLQGAATCAGTPRGALDSIGAEEVLAAVREVRSGRTVSLAAPVSTHRGPDNAEPAEHRLTAPAGGVPDPHGLDFARDRFAMNVHGDADSHLDALCHVIYDGTLYGGVSATGALSPTGASALTVGLAADGFTGPQSVLEGQFGFLRVFCTDFDEAELTRGLGYEPPVAIRLRDGREPVEIELRIAKVLVVRRALDAGTDERARSHWKRLGFAQQLRRN